MYSNCDIVHCLYYYFCQATEYIRLSYNIAAELAMLFALILSFLFILPLVYINFNCYLF